MSDDMKPYILKWYWRYYSLGVDDDSWWDNVDDAVRSCAADIDAQAAAPAGLEVWDGDGYQYIGRKELDGLLDAYWQQESERERAAPPREWAGAIEVHAPNGMSGLRGNGQAEWAQYSTYESEERLQADIERLQQRIGEGRVRRVPYPKP